MYTKETRIRMASDLLLDITNIRKKQWNKDLKENYLELKSQNPAKTASKYGRIEKAIFRNLRLK